MRLNFKSVIAAALVISFAEFVMAGQIIRVIRDKNKVEAISVNASQHEPSQKIKLRSLPQFLREDAPPSNSIYEEMLVSDSQFEFMKENLNFPQVDIAQSWPESEVQTLVLQGPIKNRINLTIVGDGYTASEKAKFFADANRTMRGLFDGETFKSYLPLFNVFAVFVPSKESGLSNTIRKDTALGLYRDPPNSTRAIMVGKAGEARRALALAPATDYSILLANDDFYGGLGGEFAITTRSIESGLIVLRHELGHNFSNVGEEYDGGYVYSGANFSSSADTDWKQWTDDQTITKFESRPLFGEYVWANLHNAPYKQKFDFPNDSGWSFNFQLSAVGWSSDEDVKIRVDDKPIVLRGKFVTDRSFFYPREPIPLNPGQHYMEVKENRNDGDNILGSIRAWAFPPGYDFSADRVGAFATFDDGNNKVGYRPTHQSCLMRNMETAKFCAVDQENMWLRFFERISLIDSLSTKTSSDGSKQVVLQTPSLPDLEISWYKSVKGKRVELKEFKNQKEWTMRSSLNSDLRMNDQVIAQVRFRSLEIRKNSARLTSEASLKLKLK